MSFWKDLEKRKRLRAFPIVKKKEWIGTLTFRQYSDAVRIWTEEKDEERAYERIGNYFKLKRASSINLRAQIEEILGAVAHWQSLDKLIVTEPDSDEIAAGILIASRESGHLGVAISLARDFGMDPDAVLDWKYSKVWNILKCDYLQATYAAKYREVMEKKKENEKHAKSRVFTHVD